MTPRELAENHAREWLHRYGINTDRYTSGGSDHPAMKSLPDAFEAFAETVRRDERERCVRIAIDGCLVPPDGGSPTAEENELCERIAGRIRGVEESDDPAS